MVVKHFTCVLSFVALQLEGVPFPAEVWPLGNAFAQHAQAGPQQMSKELGRCSSRWLRISAADSAEDSLEVEHASMPRPLRERRSCAD